MPQPTQSDLHVNRPLTNVSIMAVQDEAEFIADQVFKNIPSDMASNSYFVYDPADFHRDSVQLRADGAESAGDGWAVTTDQYGCDVWALHHDVSDRRRANTDDPLNEDEDATRYLTHKAMLRREIDWTANFFTTNVWTGQQASPLSLGTVSNGSFVPTTKFDNASGVPIKLLKEQLILNKALTGFRCNTLVMSEQVWNALQESADFLGRINGGATSTDPAIVTLNHLKAVLNIPNIYIGGAIKNTAKEGQTASNAFVYGKSMLLCYVPSNPGVRQPSCGYTFTWKQYGSAFGGQRIKKFRMEQNASDRIEIEMAYDMKVVTPAMGIFVDQCLT